MECSICYEAYDQAARIPKSVPCGHTVCLQCLQRCDRRQCPTCRSVFNVAPGELPNNFALLRLMEERDSHRPPGAPGLWCWDCRAAAARHCRDDHEVLAVKAALRRHLSADALQQAAEQLQGLQRLAQEEDALHALRLISAPSWDLTLRAGDHQLHGTLTNAEDPLTKALWVVVATRAALTEDRGAVQDPPPAAARPPAAALDPPPAAARPPAAALDPPPAAARPPAAALDPPPAAALPNATLDPSPAEAPPPREMNVDYVGWAAFGDRQEEKAAALQQAQGVVRLVGVWCNSDPAWSLQLLQRAAPTVERLHVCRSREEHLRAVHAMPRLRRLYVWCADRALDARPPELGALPPGHSGLRWIRVYDLPRVTLQSLLRAHAGTLEELELAVGTPGEMRWPGSCSDLHYLLQQCGLRALRRIVLWRGCSHTVCGEQRAAVREALALPGLQVLCSLCDRVQREDP